MKGRTSHANTNSGGDEPARELAPDGSAPPTRRELAEDDMEDTSRTRARTSTPMPTRTESSSGEREARDEAREADASVSSASAPRARLASGDAELAGREHPSEIAGRLEDDARHASRPSAPSIRDACAATEPTRTPRRRKSRSAAGAPR